MTDSKHAEQPRICDDCIALAHSIAEAGPPQDAVFAPCRHNGAIGLASKQGPNIVSWNVQGPIKADDFDAFAIAILATCKQKGIHPHPITQQ